LPGTGTGGRMTLTTVYWAESLALLLLATLLRLSLF
jgi:hypothetical protein